MKTVKTPPTQIHKSKEPNLRTLLKDKTKWLSVKAAALELDVSTSTTYRLIKEGKLTAINRGSRNILILESSLDEYLQSINPSFKKVG